MAAGKKKTWESLLELGAPCSAEKFREEVKSQYAETVKPLGWSGDELCMHPDAAKEFCNGVRKRVRFQGIPDDLILRTLINIRRRGGGEVNMQPEKLS